VEEYCAIAADRMDGLSFNERVRFLRLLTDEITFEGSRVRIKGVIPVISDEPSASNEGRRDLPGSPVSGTGSLAGQIAHANEENPLIAADRIATTRVYSRGHNSVESIPFQLSQDSPQPIHPLHQQISHDDLRKAVEKDPAATLEKLCGLFKKERGIKISITTMCRLVKRYQIVR
jgi:hypothetical protein